MENTAQVLQSQMVDEIGDLPYREAVAAPSPVLSTRYAYRKEQSTVSRTPKHKAAIRKDRIVPIALGIITVIGAVSLGFALFSGALMSLAFGLILGLLGYHLGSHLFLGQAGTKQ